MGKIDASQKRTRKAWLWLCLVVGLTGGGVLTLDAFLRWKERRSLTRGIAEAREITLALRDCAQSKGGTYPSSLEELIPRGIPESYIYRTLPNGEKETRWLYFGDEADLEVGSIPIIAEVQLRRPSTQHGRIVASNDTSAAFWPEYAWQVYFRGDGNKLALPDRPKRTATTGTER